MAEPATPLVSVVLCSHDAGDFLEPQLDSILAQTHRALQVIVVDDGSTDATRERLIAYATRDPRIELVLHRNQLGMLPRLEEGLARVRGDFVAPSDQDDVWAPDKVESLLGQLGSCAAIYSASALVDEEERSLDQTLLESLGGLEPVAGRDPWPLFWHNTVSGHATLFRASLLPALLPFDPRLMYDHQIGILATVHGGLAYCDRPLVRHRIHANNQVSRLPDAKPQRRDPTRAIERRIMRRWRLRATLAEHGAYFAGRAVDPGFTQRDVARLERARDTFSERAFDFGFFLELVKQRRRFFRPHHATLRWAWRTARCERWYDPSSARGRISAARRTRAGIDR